MDRATRRRLEGARRGNRLTALLDTNVIIRHLTGEPPAMARQASKLLGSGRRLVLTELVAAECVYVLSSFYELSAIEIATLLRSAFAVPSIDVINQDVLLRALSIFEEHRIGFADAYLIAVAELSGIDAVASFDRDIERVGTVERVTG